MKRSTFVVGLAALLLLQAAQGLFAQEAAEVQETTSLSRVSEDPSTESAGLRDAKHAAEERLVVLWTSGDRDVALKMVFMYTFNAKRRGWWDDITFIVWGPSAKLLAADEELQLGIQKMKEAGIVLEACQACSDQYGVSDALRNLGIDVKYMGEALTSYIKEGRHVLSF